MKILYLILTHWASFKYWKETKKGKYPIAETKGAGYYFMVGFFHSPIGMIQEWPMKSGKTGLFRLVDYRLYRDPDDMIEKSWWHFIGYKGMKAIKDCSFCECLALYKPK